MKVGDLVVQKGWETDGVGVVIRLWDAGKMIDRASVQWPGGAVAMYRSQLKVISESR